MSNSVRPHGLQPTRLPRPWDSPGKNTGVSCHFLLQGVKVESESEVAQSCLTLSDPTDCSPSGSSVHGIFRATVLEWGAIASSHTSAIELNSRNISFCRYSFLWDFKICTHYISSIKKFLLTKTVHLGDSAYCIVLI